eukprot:3625026-Rhodomonas_salina.1
MSLLHAVSVLQMQRYTLSQYQKQHTLSQYGRSCSHLLFCRPGRPRRSGSTIRYLSTGHRIAAA